jgi:mono/diheme cytochrome c family protein
MKRLVLIALVVAVGFVFAAPAFAQGNAAAGEKVFVAQKCSMCHSIAGKGNKKNPLDEVGSKLKPEEIREWIVTPQEAAAKAKVTAAMKAYDKLPKADLDNLVAYLETLKKK